MTKRLALEGGTATRTTPLPPWPHFAEDEIKAVAKVLRSGRVNQWTGPEVNAFERAFADYIGVKHAIAVANGTVSLELILRAWNIGPGDEVIVTPRSFLASASTVAFVGATPIFADIDPETQTFSAETIAPLITPRTRALMVVHLAGRPAEMDGIMELANKHDLKVLEDCAQCHGAIYRGEMTGAIGHAGSFSFCQDKIMTLGGEGGLITTDDDDLFRRIWELKDHGKSREAVFEREHPPGFRWLHESLGTNARMTGMQAAIGLKQLEKLEDWIEARTSNANMLLSRFRHHPALHFPEPPSHVRHVWYKVYGFIRPEALKPNWSRDRILAALQAEGIPGLSGSCSEMYLEKVFQDTGLAPEERLPIAKALGETSIMFMCHPTLGEDDMKDIADAVEKVMREASRP